MKQTISFGKWKLKISSDETVNDLGKENKYDVIGTLFHDRWQFSFRSQELTRCTNKYIVIINYFIPEDAFEVLKLPFKNILWFIQGIKKLDNL